MRLRATDGAQDLLPHTPDEGNEPGSARVVYIINIIQTISIYLFSMALKPSVGIWPLFLFLDFLHTVCRTPWPGDQPVARQSSAHRIA